MQAGKGVTSVRLTTAAVVLIAAVLLRAYEIPPIPTWFYVLAWYPTLVILDEVVVLLGDDLVRVRGDQLSAAGLVLRLPPGGPGRALARHHSIARHGGPRRAAPRAPAGPTGRVARPPAPRLHPRAAAPGDRRLGRLGTARGCTGLPTLSLPADLGRSLAHRRAALVPARSRALAVCGYDPRQLGADRTAHGRGSLRRGAVGVLQRHRAGPLDLHRPLPRAPEDLRDAAGGFPRLPVLRA